MEKLNQIISSADWAMQKDRFEAFVESRASIAVEAKQGDISEIQGRVAVLPFRGTMVNRFANFPPLVIDQTAMAQEVKKLGMDKTVGAIVLDVDSGGGTVEGTPELTAEIANATKKKPVIASVNGWAGSAMFWTVSAATKIVASPSAMIGSVGVIATHLDDSKALEDAGYKVEYITSTDSPYKAEGMGELSDESREYLQSRVDKIHDQFVTALAKNRGVSKSHVNAEFGRGRMFYADEAKERGMIDEIGTLDDVMNELAQRQKNRNRARAAKFRSNRG